VPVAAATALTSSLDAPADWRAAAACREVDVEAFFAVDEASQQEAIAICETCPVRVECLEHAIAAREQYGVWGGLREQDRKRLVRARRRDAAA
jgi:WhiB family transcriptional regulator, redox-sensing transcriptional regulator